MTIRDIVIPVIIIAIMCIGPIMTVVYATRQCEMDVEGKSIEE